MNNSNEIKGIWYNEEIKSEGEIHIYSSFDPTVVICSLYSEPLEPKTYADAAFICTAVNEYDKLKEDNAALLDALKTAVNVIKDWNGAATFDIYYDHAPEMKLIRETLTKAEAFKK